MRDHEGWYRLTAVLLNSGILKRIQTPYSLLNFILGFWRRQYLYNPFKIGQAAEFKFESKFEPLPVISLEENMLPLLQ